MWPHENGLFLNPILKQECEFVLHKKQHKLWKCIAQRHFKLKCAQNNTSPYFTWLNNCATREVTLEDTMQNIRVTGTQLQNVSNVTMAPPPTQSTP
jgi:hypothetical protein